MRIGVGERAIDQHRQHDAGHGEAAGKEQNQCGTLTGRAEGSTSHHHTALHLLHSKPQFIVLFKQIQKNLYTVE
jgi:hypothetical protein